jgi:DNA mismatch repair protein MutS2
MLDLLRELPDAELVLTLIAEEASLRQVDFFELKAFLWKGREIERLLGEREVRYSWWPVVDWEMLLRRLNPPGELLPAFSLDDCGDEELTLLRDEAAALDARMLAARKEQSEGLRSRYGRAPGRDGTYVWDRERGDVLAKAAADPELTLVQENRFEAVYRVAEPTGVEALRQRRDEVQTQIEDREVLVLQGLADSFRPDVEALRSAWAALGRLDWTLAKALLALKWQGEVPKFPVWEKDEQALWRVDAGWHPLARQSVEARGGRFTPLDLVLSPGVGLITGPNMGGKTVVLKTFGLLQALAQHAMSVPAGGFHFQPVERIGMSGGDEQSLTAGLSSFGAEMHRLSGLLRTRGRALLLLDEVARTTNPQEGEALATGLASFLLGSGHMAVLASHFPKLTEIPGLQQFRVAGLRREVLDALQAGGRAEDLLSRLQSAMDYRLVRSDEGAVPHDAVAIARCFGLPDDMIRKTEEVLCGKEGF